MCLFLLWALLLLAAPPLLHAQELPFTHYTTESEVNPLPSAGITALYQDRQGFLWIAAFGAGLVRYDGHTLRNYGYSDSLTTTSVWALAEDGPGRLWVLSEEGLFVSERPLGDYTDTNQIRFTTRIGTIPLHQGQAASRRHMIADRRGWIWAGFLDGTIVRYRIDGPDAVAVDTIPLPPSPNGTKEHLTAIIGRRDGSVWIGLPNGRMMVVEGERTTATVVDAMPCADLTTMYESGSGVLWGGCRNGVLWTLSEQGEGRRFVPLGVTYPGMVTALLQDPAGGMWVGGLGGALMVVPAGGAPPIVYTRRQGLLDENIWDLMRDREGSYWIAQNNGLSKLRADHEAFTHYSGNARAGNTPILPATDVDSVLPPFTLAASAGGDSLSLLVAGTPAGAALIRGDGAVEHLTAERGLTSNLVLALCRDDERGIWIGTRDGANHLTFDPDATPPGALHRRTVSLFGRTAHLARFALGHVNTCHTLALPVDDGNTRTEAVTCFTGYSPLRCLAGRRWFTFGSASGLPANHTWTLTADARGYIYVGTNSRGIYRSTRPLSVKALNEVATVTGTGSLADHEVSEPLFALLSEEVEGTGFSSFAWAGDVLWAVGGEILALEGDPMRITTRLGREAGIDANPESIAYAPRTGTLWVGTEKGLLEIDPRTRTVARWLTRADGLVGNVVWGPGAVQVGPDGTVYFATSTGLTLYRPHLDRQNATAPAPRLRQARFTEDESGHNELNLAYAALSFANEKKVRYRTRLRGYEEDWSPETTETSVRYTNLGAFLFPKTYTFEVVAANEDGVWSEAPLAYAVAVQPAWWLRWWAFLFYLLLAAVGVLVVDRIQRRRLIARERERSLLREKELRAEAAEAWANYLQAVNERQTQELEQARRLQLSMLPEHVPAHPLVEIATYMETATEVGGDYYDFHLADDGTLTLTIGDATGHGLQAGTMVTAMKSLWNAYAQEDDLEEVLRKASRALRQMHLPKLYMALALARLRDATLEFVGAGMPPALLYRARTGTIETVPLKGMPLGGPAPYPYRRQCVTLAEGDTVVLMSDGFPELRRETGEWLGYDRVVDLFAAVAGQPAEAVVTHLSGTVRQWCNGQGPGDDVTFLVMKMKTPASLSPSGSSVPS